MSLADDHIFITICFLMVIDCVGRTESRLGSLDGFLC